MKATEKLKALLYTCNLDFKAKEFMVRIFLYGLGFGVGLALIVYAFDAELAPWVGLGVFVVFEVCVYGVLIVSASSRIGKIEEMLPDFLTLMASNLRSGLTPDRALLLSARPEFGPLTSEIDRTAKETMTGTSFPDAFMKMGMRVDSEVFAKTVRLIVEGVRSGGNLADLLDNTALDIRRFSAIRKEVAATVLIYSLFMFAAAGIGGPVLYAVSNLLIEVISDMKAKMGAFSSDATNYLPLFKGTSVIDPNLVFDYSIIAIFVTAFFGAIAAGVVSKGKESGGLPYIPILIALAFVVFFASKYFLGILLENLFLM